MRCDACGRFTRHLNDVWTNPPHHGIDREVCDDCHRPHALAATGLTDTTTEKET